MASTNSQSQSPALTMISEGTSVKGTVNTQTDIRIAGKVEGEISSKSKILVTSSGKVNGDLKSVDADVAGRIEGSIKVSNKLYLRKSAVVDGDIYSKSLIVEEGGKINGSCHMGSHLQKVDGASDAEYSESTVVKSAEEK